MKTERETMRALMEAVAQPNKVSSLASLNSFLKSLPDYYHEHGSSSAANNSIYRGRGNQDLVKMAQYLKDNGYSKVLDRDGDQEWQKVVGKPYGDSSNMRSYHKVSIRHKDGHVYNVSHIRSMQ